MDDVLADATGQFLAWYKRDFGVEVTREMLSHKEEGAGFPEHLEVVKSYPYQAGFFRTMAVQANAVEVVEALNSKHEVFIVSAAMEFPQSLSEKLEWLGEHFPFLTWKQIVFCGSKAIVHGDYMIDDLPYNLETFQGERWLFTAPHNMHYGHFDRVNSWLEIKRRFEL